MTLVSRAVATRGGSIAMLADLPAHPLHGLLCERGPVLDRHSNVQGTPLHDPDFGRYGLDLDSPILNGDLEGHSRTDSCLIANGLGQNQPAGGVDGRLDGILHGTEATT